MTNDRYLFRGFHKDENGEETIYLNGEEIKGKWVYDGVYNDGIMAFIINYDVDLIEEISEFKHIQVIPETISQYTGLDDSTGNKIFENDVVEEGCNGLVSSVIYDNEIGTYKLKNLGDYYIKDAPIEWEVIGTIFDKEVK